MTTAIAEETHLQVESCLESRKRRFATNEHLKMAEADILAHDEKLELLDGQLYKKMSPVDLPRFWRVARLTKLFERKLGENVFAFDCRRNAISFALALSRREFLRR